MLLKQENFLRGGGVLEIFSPQEFVYLGYCYALQRVSMSYDALNWSKSLWCGGVRTYFSVQLTDREQHQLPDDHSCEGLHVRFDW